MGNPNSGKGKASRAEDLMQHQRNKKPKRKTENIEEENFERENTFCKLPDISENNQELVQDFDLEIDQPKMQDFIDVIENSDILEDKDLSAELLFLMNYFITMKKNKNIELFGNESDVLLGNQFPGI